MAYVCPECGARFPSDETCTDRFNTSQLTELEQPAYFTVHHLSVPCYMLQHNQYSRVGWLLVRDLLDKFINRGWTPEMARRENRAQFSSGKRKWSFTRGEKLTGVESIAWTRSIADVRMETAEHYCGDVREWAISILADSAALVQSQ